MTKDPRSPSPEKQLLDIIERPESAAGKPNAGLRYQRSGGFALFQIGNSFSALFQKLPATMRRCGVICDIRVFNGILMVGFAWLAVLFLMTIVQGSKLLHQQIAAGVRATQQAVKEISPPLPSMLQAANYYLEKAQKRDIFSLEQPAVLNPEASRGPSQRILEATQQLKLVGISWSPDPDVMIEDTKTNHTFFLKQGQLIEDDVYLGTVFKEKVVLRYKGEELELR